MTDDTRSALITEEPPTGSVVAIDWGGHRQEVWVSNRANVGNWYSADIPMRGGHHPTWWDVADRAKGRTLTLLVPAARDAYAAGFDAGVQKVGNAVEQVIGDARMHVNGAYPDGH